MCIFSFIAAAMHFGDIIRWSFYPGRPLSYRTTRLMTLDIYHFGWLPLPSNYPSCLKILVNDFHPHHLSIPIALPKRDAASIDCRNLITPSLKLRTVAHRRKENIIWPLRLDVCYLDYRQLFHSHNDLKLTGRQDKNMKKEG